MIRSVLIALPVAALGWGGLLLGLARFSDVAPGYVVPLATEDLLRDLPPEMRIVARSRFGITVQSDGEEVARRLYASGAYLVLPAGLPGCLPLTGRGNTDG